MGGGKQTPDEIVKMAMKYAEEYGGKPAHWAQFIRGKSLKIGEGVEGPEMLDLGSFNQGALDSERPCSRVVRRQPAARASGGVFTKACKESQRSC